MLILFQSDYFSSDFFTANRANMTVDQGKSPPQSGLRGQNKVLEAVVLVQASWTAIRRGAL
jgi:hypothetical protein